MLSLPLALADKIRRRAAMLETLIWAETEREGDAGGPDLSRKNYKLSFIPKKKNWYKPPLRSNSTPPPSLPPLSGSDGGIIHFIFIFLHVAGF